MSEMSELQERLDDESSDMMINALKGRNTTIESKPFKW